MNKTLTNDPVIPPGWIPKPKETAYNFLDYLVQFQQWQYYIRNERHLTERKNENDNG